MAEALMDRSESQALESTTVGIYRTATVVKGGRRFSFAALAVVGDRQGSVGIGYGKAPGVPAAIEKAQKDARKRLHKINLQGGTLPHPVTARYGASIVRLVPAAPGTGVIAGGTVRAVLEIAGVRDCLTKAFGSTNQKNLCKAAVEGLVSLRSKAQVASLRGVPMEATEVDQILEAGKKHMPQATSDSPKVKGPVNKFAAESGRGGGRARGGGGRGRGGGGGGGPRHDRGAPSAAPVAAAAPPSTQTPPSEPAAPAADSGSAPETPAS